MSRPVAAVGGGGEGARPPAITPTFPLGPLLRDWSAALSRAGVGSPDHDARQLVAHVLGVPAAQVALVGAVSERQRLDVDALITERAARRPLQHLTGVVGFHDLDLAVGPGVFVPRPETEVMVQHAIEWLRSQPVPPPARSWAAVDACSGSGAIALAIACAVAVDMVAIEASEQAREWFNRNAATHSGRLSARGSTLRLVAGDVSHRSVWPSPGGSDIVVSNPPYIPTGCVPRDPEVRDHDPDLALYGGRDGMDVVRPLIAHAASALRPGGLLLIEHSDDQGGPDGVPGLVNACGLFDHVADHPDWTGRPRFTSAVRSG